MKKVRRTDDNPFRDVDNAHSSLLIGLEIIREFQLDAREPIPQSRFENNTVGNCLSMFQIQRIRELNTIGLIKQHSFAH
jgi:hypothetical protein